MTLIKSSLASLPLYYMSLFMVPKGVIEKIAKIQRRFLWSGDMDKKALSLVAWNIVELPKEFGGLGIGNMVHRNIALLFKWIWKFFQYPSLPWRQIIKEKYGYPDTLSIRDIEIPKSGGPWKRICESIIKNPAAKNIAYQGLRKGVGDGVDIPSFGMISG